MLSGAIHQDTITAVKVDGIFERAALFILRWWIALAWAGVIAALFVVPLFGLIEGISFLSKWVSVCVR